MMNSGLGKWGFGTAAWMKQASSAGAVLSKVVLTLALTAGLSGCLESGGDDTAPVTVGASSPSGTTPAPVETAPVNHPPEVSGVPAAAVQAGQTFSFVPTASDEDEDFLEFAITNKPSWATFDVETGALNGVPADADVRQTDDITITVTDGRDERAIGPFRINVTARSQAPAPANTAPTIIGSPPRTVDAGMLYSFLPTAADANGDALTFSISNRPSWATFSSASGSLTGTPTTAQANTYSNIVISVSDGKVLTSLPAFSIQVKSSNRAPTISGSPASTAQVTQAYSFTPAGSDPDQDTLTYSITNKPSWATFTATTGRLSGTPSAANVGSYTAITIKVSDGKLTAALAAFSINVTAAANKAPTISGTPSTTAQVGVAYSFTPTGADPDGDTVAYSIQNRPSWAAFDTLSGKLSGTPSAAGTFSNIIISISDTKTTASLAAFSITVSAATSTNRAPTLSGTPATAVSVNSTYNFQPVAADADGDALGWSIQNKPSWATFSTATGTLSGTPVAGNVGTTSNIVISVTDGKSTVSLPGFAIAVNAAAATGSATLNWQAPTQNTDGSALTDLDGYRIAYGTSVTALNQTIDVSNATVTTYVVDQLSSGTWYFAVKAYTTAGAESANSNVTSKTIP